MWWLAPLLLFSRKADVKKPDCFTTWRLVYLYKSEQFFKCKSEQLFAVTKWKMDPQGLWYSVTCKLLFYLIQQETPDIWCMPLNIICLQQVNQHKKHNFFLYMYPWPTVKDLLFAQPDPILRGIYHIPQTIPLRRIWSSQGENLISFTKALQVWCRQT